MRDRAIAILNDIKNLLTYYACHASGHRAVNGKVVSAEGRVRHASPRSGRKDGSGLRDCKACLDGTKGARRSAR